MKRYRDYKIICNNQEEAKGLLQEIAKECATDNYPFYKTIESQNIPKGPIWILSNAEGSIQSRIILFNSEYDSSIVSIANIIPTEESGCSGLSEEEYNKILAKFTNIVIDEICKDTTRYTIETNAENYTIEELIPKTIEKLNTWVNMFPLSEHPFDRKRWFDFITTLHENNEEFLVGDFEQWLSEEKEWSESDIIKFTFKLEEQLALLKYYDKHS
ncbi:MAG: hypothetical protein PHD45_08550 [Bacteroidales bacterium]|nr:hypothetical protein [Bacteroidales bacterium]